MFSVKKFSSLFKRHSLTEVCRFYRRYYDLFEKDLKKDTSAI